MFCSNKKYQILNLKVNKDILCGLGFCICDVNDPYFFCPNIKLERKVFFEFDDRIPKRYRTAKFITDRQIPKINNLNALRKSFYSDTDCYISKKINDKKIHHDDYAIDEKKFIEYKKIKIIEGAGNTLDSPCKNPFSKKVLMRQKAKEMSEIYVPAFYNVMSNNSICLEYEKLEKLHQNEKIFILPNPDVISLDKSEENLVESIVSTDENELYNPYILPTNKFFDKEYFNKETETKDGNNIICQNNSKSSMKVSNISKKCDAILNICNYINKENNDFSKKVQPLKSLESKIDLIINEIKEIKLSINNIMIMESNAREVKKGKIKFNLNDYDLNNYRISKNNA